MLITFRKTIDAAFEYNMKVVHGRRVSRHVSLYSSRLGYSMFEHTIPRLSAYFSEASGTISELSPTGMLVDELQALASRNSPRARRNITPPRPRADPSELVARPSTHAAQQHQTHPTAPAWLLQRPHGYPTHAPGLPRGRSVSAPVASQPAQLAYPRSRFSSGTPFPSGGAFLPSYEWPHARLSTSSSLCRYNRVQQVSRRWSGPFWVACFYDRRMDGRLQRSYTGGSCCIPDVHGDAHADRASAFLVPSQVPRPLAQPRRRHAPESHLPSVSPMSESSHGSLVERRRGASGRDLSCETRGSPTRRKPSTSAGGVHHKSAHPTSALKGAHQSAEPTSALRPVQPRCQEPASAQRRRPARSPVHNGGQRQLLAASQRLQQHAALPASPSSPTSTVTTREVSISTNTRHFTHIHDRRGFGSLPPTYSTRIV